MSETKVGVECGVALTLWLALIYRLDRQPWRVVLALRLESDLEVFAALVREASP